MDPEKIANTDDLFAADTAAAAAPVTDAAADVVADAVAEAVEAAAPVSDTVEVAAVADAPVAEPTMLELAANPDAAATPDTKTDKPAEAAPTADAEKPAEAAAATDPAEPAVVAPEPVEYTYELPEILQMDDAARETTHAALDAFRANPANPQPLIDLHAAKMQEYATALQKQQWDTFNDTRKQWREMVTQDDEIGGSGHQTAMRAIARMRDRFASSEKPGTPQYDADLAAFDGFLRATGAGDHPVFLKTLHRIAQVYDEPDMGPSEVQPAPQKGRKGVLYDHPRSGKAS